MSNKDAKFAALQVHTKEDVTGHHVNTLLEIISNLRPFLQGGGDESFGTPERDGGVTSSVETTIIKAASRLDDLLDDAARWTCTDSNALHESVMESQEAHRKFLRAQTEATREIQRPATLFKPTLYTNDNLFYAIYGGDGTSSAIIGSGLTPDEALLDFDAAFHRTVEDQTRLALKEPTPTLPLTIKPTKKKKQI